MSRKRIRPSEPPPSSSAGAVDAGRSKNVERSDDLTDTILNTLRGSDNGRSMKLKSLRKLVLLSIQCDHDNTKETKKRFKKKVQKLEADGRVTLSEEGVITLAKSERSKSKKQKKDKKKRKKTDLDEKRDAVEGVDRDYDAKNKRRKGSEVDGADKDAERAPTARSCTRRNIPPPPPLLSSAPDATTSTKVDPWSRNGYGEEVPRLSISDGNFSLSEISLVIESIVEYCSSRGIKPSELCSDDTRKKKSEGAWKKIARVVPHRTVRSVYRVGIRQFHSFERGKWTEEECDKLLQLVMQFGKKWATIQHKINRSADSCHDKYREISSEYIKGPWSDSETLLLQSLIRKHLRADPNIDMKELGKKVEREGIELPWSAISIAMKKRSRISCLKKWKTMTAAKRTRTVAVREIDEDGRLLAFLKNSGARRVSDVPWSSSGYHEGDPLERWGELIDTHVSNADMFDLPVWQLATYVIGRREIMESKRAADEAAATAENAADVVQSSSL